MLYEVITIPVVKENRLIGFIEVIRNFDTLKNYFANYDIDLLVLMDAMKICGD